jgi:hypothetical protein
MHYVQQSDLKYMDPIDRACVLSSSQWEVTNLPTRRFDVTAVCAGQVVTDLDIHRPCGHYGLAWTGSRIENHRWVKEFSWLWDNCCEACDFYDTEEEVK